MDFQVRHVSIALGDQDLSAKNDNNKNSAAGDFIVTDLQYYHCVLTLQESADTITSKHRQPTLLRTVWPGSAGVRYKQASTPNTASLRTKNGLTRFCRRYIQASIDSKTLPVWGSRTVWLDSASVRYKQASTAKPCQFEDQELSDQVPQALDTVRRTRMLHSGLWRCDYKGIWAVFHMQPCWLYQPWWDVPVVSSIVLTTRLRQKVPAACSCTQV